MAKIHPNPPDRCAESPIGLAGVGFVVWGDRVAAKDYPIEYCAASVALAMIRGINASPAGTSHVSANDEKFRC
jgi:hypothetical protein